MFLFSSSCQPNVPLLYFTSKLPFPLKYKTWDTAKSLTSDNGWELIVLVKIIITFFSFSEAAAISPLTT